MLSVSSNTTGEAKTFGRDRMCLAAQSPAAPAPITATLSNIVQILKKSNAELKVYHNIYIGRKGAQGPGQLESREC